MLFSSVCLLKWRYVETHERFSMANVGLSIAMSRGVRYMTLLGLGRNLGGALSTERVRRSLWRELRKGTTHVLQRQHDVRPICENLITDPWIRHSKEIKEPSVERPWGLYQGRIVGRTASTRAGGGKERGYEMGGRRE